MFGGSGDSHNPDSVWRVPTETSYVSSIRADSDHVVYKIP